MEVKLKLAQLDVSKIQNIIKKAQFMKLFETNGSAWAVKNYKGVWSFVDGKYNYRYESRCYG